METSSTARDEGPLTCESSAILAWLDLVQRRAESHPRAPRGTTRRLYEDGLIDGTLETLAQVRQAVLHGFDAAGLDGRVAYDAAGE